MRHIPIPQQMQQLMDRESEKLEQKQEALDLIDVHKKQADQSSGDRPLDLGCALSF